MRREEKTLEQKAVVREAGAELIAHARGRQAVRGELDEVVSADDVAASRRDAAAGVLDERAGHDVGTGLRRLLVVDEFAVAVVDEADAVGLDAVDFRRDGADVLDGERAAHAVAARALDLDHLRLVGDDVLDMGHVDFTRNHRQLVVEHAEFLEGARAWVVVADDRLHRVVRLARQRDELITGAQDAEEHGRQGMRARDELRAHERALRAEDLGVELLELAAADVVVGVARRRVEVRVGDAAFAHRVEDLQRIGLRYIFDVCEERLRFLEDLAFEIGDFLGE